MARHRRRPVRRGRHRAPSPFARRAMLPALAAGAVLAAAVTAALEAPPLPAASSPAPAWSADPPVPPTPPTTSTRVSRPPLSATGATRPSPAPPAPPPRRPPTTRAPEPAQRPSPEPTSRAQCPTELAGTRAHVAAAGHHLVRRFDVDLSSVLGRASRSRAGSDHPAGLALDFLVDRDTGDALADYVVAHRVELAVKYVIWEQRINLGDGWRPMEDRGGITANHFDHVHVSFERDGAGGLPC